jgi:hypothetical protein
MRPDDLTDTLAALHRAGVRWTVGEGTTPIARVRAGVQLDDMSQARLNALLPHRRQLAELAKSGRCPGCGQFAMPPLVVCYWCRQLH